MSNYLCEELVVEILKKLPVKSVLKFKSVCKSWYVLITNPNFISLHLAHTNRTFSLVTRSVDSNYTFPRKPRFSMHCDDDSFSEYKQLDSSYVVSDSYFTLVGSCNGLVCLSDNFDRLIVWNPSIGEFIRTSFTKICRELSGKCGFGFDRQNNDYKVVRIVFSKEDVAFRPFAEIFQLSSDSWKSVTIKNLDYVEYCSKPLVEWNGVLHWFAQMCNGGKNMIASFDLSSDAFQELMLPHALAEMDGDHSSVSLTVYNQSLAVIHYEERRWYTSNFKCSIWIMKEYGAAESWTKQLTIDIQNYRGLLEVLGFQGNGRILFECPSSRIVSYDPRTQRVTPLGVYGSFVEVHSYTESLVSLKGKRNNNKVKASIEE